MTEADWLVSTDPCVMLRFLGDRASARQLRLLLCAQVLTEAHLLADDRSRRAVRTAEAAADGRAGAAALGRATTAARAAWEAVDPRFPRRYGRLARTPAASPATGSAARLVRYATDPVLDAALAERAAWGLTPARRCVLAGLVRDVFGNPFRPVAFDPAWRTPDAIGLARGIYDDRAFDQLPLLSDALLDAGCDDEQFIAHCRSGGPHARGCRVVDVVLGQD